MDATPFGSLVHFAKDGPAGQPKVLVVAALAGHFSTLLRRPSGRCCPTTTSSSPTGTTPATCPSTRGGSASTPTSTT